jgi:hypothetical protein
VLIFSVSWVIKSRRSKKGKQCNGQKKEKERTKNDQQNTTQKTKDRAARTFPYLFSITHNYVKFDNVYMSI